MKRRFCSLILAFALVLSLFAGLSLTTNAANSFEKASSIAVGDYVVLVCEGAAMELSAISTTDTRYGVGTAYSSAPGGRMILEVCEGYTDGTYAFKTNGTYLYWTSGNTLNVNATLSANTSWTVSFDTDGNATICNSADATRQIFWNKTSPRFAAYSGKTVSSTYFAVQLYAAIGTVCLHTDTSYTVTTEPTCTAGGTGQYTCSDCGYSWTVSLAAAGHSYTYTPVNGAIYQYCSVCSDAQSVTMNTIAEAKAYTGTSTVYNVQGIVTYVKDRTVYIEDETGGLCVYFDVSVDTSVFDVGQELFTSSTMTTYEGLLELNKPTQYCIISSGNTLPENTSLTIVDILADTTFEYLGERVTLTELTIGVVNSTGFTTLTDSDGNSLSIYRATGLDSELAAGNIVSVTGVLSYYSDGYQLLINPSTAATDVVKTDEGTAVAVETVPISTAKAGVEETYYQVEGVVTCVQGRQIFIQDETGGIVVYLAAMPTEAPCAVGDEIRVYGSFGNYDGVLELQYVDHTNPAFFAVLSTGNAVVAQPVTIEELLADSSIEYNYFAEKVFLDDVSILEIDSNGSVLLWQNDYTIYIYCAPTLDEGCEVGAVVDVTATVSGYSYNYELVIVDASAVRYGSECLHEESVAVGDVSPTCTTDGYTGDYYCTVCGAFVLAGESIPAAHSIIRINPVEATCEAAGFTGDAYCEVCGETVEAGTEISALGHDYVRAVTDPTCTVDGYTTYTCSRCESSYTADIVNAPGHVCTYLENGDTHIYTCTVCGETGEEEHAYESGACILCNAPAPVVAPTLDENITINHSLNLASDISIIFAVKTSLLEGYDSFYLECTIPQYSGNEEVGSSVVLIEEYTLNGSYYYFTLTGMTAVQMNDMIDATLYMMKGDVEYISNPDTYSVATYAYSQLSKTAASETLKKLCADLLRYGSAAQIYKGHRTDSLADANMTEEQKGYLTDLSTVTFGNNSSQLGDLTNGSITWLGKVLSLDTKVTLKFVVNTASYTGSLDDLSMHVSYANYLGENVTAVVTDIEKYGTNDGWYSFSFESLLAAELRTVVSVAVYEGDTQVSETLRYSADTYGNGKSGTLLTACQALMAYSDSALAYFTN